MGKLRVLDLFSGIGGFSLGLERTGGFETVAFCEIEEFPRRVLAKHWPDVPCYRDVRELNADTLARDGIAVDVICGGFPCQDISTAGLGAGLDGARSGLWSEIARLAGELRPQFVIVENVAALLSRGLDRVLGDLAALGFDAEWHCIPASAVGAPHIRDRVWIVAYPQHTNANCLRSHREKVNIDRNTELSNEQIREPRQVGEDVADAIGFRLERFRVAKVSKQSGAEKHPWRSSPRGDRVALADGRSWEVEPNVGRVADGVPARVDRLKSLGNAVVPQIPELIGRAILERMAA
ncbi:MAG: DNA cytosine methyltransferase [Devosia marina]|uniref:DNA cytosine methyltransferase n=1 Tax=Devosia marina TaxID=2683198 RepID=UPI0032EDD3C8